MSLLAQHLRHFLFRPLVPVRHHTGYIPFEGRLGDRDVEYERILKQLRQLNLQPVKRIHFSFDPFYPRIRTIRCLMFFFSKDKIRATNFKCLFKTDVKSDGSEPWMRVELNKGQKILFKLGGLNPEESLFHFNKIVLPLVEEVKEAVVESKGAKRRK